MLGNHKTATVQPGPSRTILGLSDTVAAHTIPSEEHWQDSALFAGRGVQVSEASDFDVDLDGVRLRM